MGNIPDLKTLLRSINQFVPQGHQDLDQNENMFIYS